MPPSTPPAERTPLPFEILAKIANHLDKADALSFARVAKDFTSPAEPAVWREITLTKPTKSYTIGVGQLQAELLRCGFVLSPEDRDEMEKPAWVSRLSTRWTRLADRKYDELFELLYRERIRSLLYAGVLNPIRWRWVESITVAPHLGVMDELLVLLEEGSRTVKRLHLLTNAVRGIGGENESLEMRMLERSSKLSEIGLTLSFDSLTDLRIDHHAIECIPLLLSKAPHLVSLAFHVESEPLTPREGSTPRSALPRVLSKPTGLRELDISYFDKNNYDIFADPFDTLADLLENSPLLERLSFSAGSYEASDKDRRLLRRIREKVSLTDLHWDWEPQVDTDMGLEPESSEVLSTLTKLQRLSTTYNLGVLPTTELLPIFPTVDKLFMSLSDYPRSDFEHQLFYIADSPLVSIIEAGFASWLKANLSLRYIHFNHGKAINTDVSRRLDDPERPKLGTALIRSVRHGNGELLHARFYIIRIRLMSPDRRGPAFQKRLVFGDLTWEGNLFGHPADLPRYTAEAEPAWHHFTEFEGAAVPLAVIRQMRAVEGVGDEDDWGRRGVEVGDEAWKVLTDWRASV